MSELTRGCPLGKCTIRIAPEKFACLRHWHALTQSQRDRINDAWYRYKNSDQGAAALAVLTAEQDQVIAEFAAAEAAWDQPRLGQCSMCGAQVLSIKTTAGPRVALNAVPLDGPVAQEGDYWIKDGLAIAYTGLLWAEKPVGDRYRCHRDTCPHADKQRRRRHGRA